MELLLLLTAFFASLTGSASADRAGVAQPGVAVVRAAQVARAAVQPQRAPLPQVATPAFTRPDHAVFAPLAAAPMHSVRLAFERRLE